jgi:glycosyltransferase involved in cell wall biosynthesis
MKSPKFSIIIPVYSESTSNFDRKKVIHRTIRSVLNQQYPNWELILVSDGCRDGMNEILQSYADKDERIKVILQEPQNRAIARNNGMDNATGEWLCWLDSDDEYSSHYLRELDRATIEMPEYKIFNFASLIYFPDHRSTIREAFRPKIEGEGHEWFRAGHIGAGSFIFRRDLWNSDPKYRIPDECSPYGFAAASGFDMRFEPGREDVEFNSEDAFTDHKIRVGISLGNPWGDDFLQFYYLTRDNISKALDVALYIQYPRSSEDGYEYF